MTKIIIGRFFSLLISLSIIISFGADYVGASTINAIQQTSNSHIEIRSYKIKRTKQLIGKDGYQAEIEFKNNTKNELKLINFSFEGYDSKGVEILSSQNNTNDVGQTISAGKTVKVTLLFPINLAALNIRIDKYETPDGNEYITAKEKDFILDFAELSKEYSTQNNSCIYEQVSNSGDVAITGYSTFFIVETPAVKVKFKNNTNKVITSVQAKVICDNMEEELTYNAKLLIDSGKEAVHSGWGIANDVKSIKIGIISYTTENGSAHIIEKDKISWERIDLE